MGGRTASGDSSWPSSESHGLFVGISAGVAGSDGPAAKQYLEQIQRRTGTHWLRERLRWDVVEPERGRFDFSRYDRFMLLAARHGQDVIALLDSGPGWAVPSPAALPRDPAAYAEYVAAIVARYGPHGSLWRNHPRLARFGVKAVELWNEPYYDSGNGGRYDPAQYAELVKAATTAGREANPDVRFLLSAETTGQQKGRVWTRWIDALYRARPDLNRYFDGVAVHPYAPDTTGPPIGEGFRQMRRVELIHQIFQGHGAVDKPLWITEIGWPTCDTASTGQIRCTNNDGQLADFEHLMSYAKGSWSSYVRAVMVFNYRDANCVRSDSECDYGMVNVDGSPKPLLSAFAGFARSSS